MVGYYERVVSWQGRMAAAVRLCFFPGQSASADSTASYIICVFRQAPQRKTQRCQLDKIFESVSYHAVKACTFVVRVTALDAALDSRYFVTIFGSCQRLQNVTDQAQKT